MRYKEFEEKIKSWGQEHDYVTRVSIEYFQTSIQVEYNGDFYFITGISNRHPFVIDTDWVHFNDIEKYAKAELFHILVDFAKTLPEDREDEKRLIIPLPNLVTTDGRQAYLTYKDGNFLASRRDETLIQTWKEKHLKYVPEFYRHFAVEFNEGEELEDDYKK